MITIDGGTGRVIVGPVRLVPPAIDENFGTILGWADEFSRLRVRANADTPEDAAKAREFGAMGIGLCRTEHMFMAPDRLPIVQEMIMATNERERRAALDRLLPVQQADFEGIFEAMAGFPVTIRLLDPPLHEFLPAPEEATSDAMRQRIFELHEANPMLGTRGCRLGLQFPEIYEMQVRAIVRAAAAVEARAGEAPLVEIMHPLVGFREELARLRELTERIAAEEPSVAYLCGTMIELPRACIRANEIAEVADFCSFGTNDLTQTALGFSRDDAEGKFLTYYLEHGILEHNPFEVLDQDGVGDLMRIAIERGRGVKPELKMGICGEHGGEPRSVAFCHRHRPRLRQLLALPRPDRAPRRRAGRSRRLRRDRARHRRVAVPRAPASAGCQGLVRGCEYHRPDERRIRSHPRDRDRHRPDRVDRAREDRPDRAAGQHRARRAPRPLPAHARPGPPLARAVLRSPRPARRHARAGGDVPAAAGDHRGQRDDLDRHRLLLHSHRCRCARPTRSPNLLFAIEQLTVTTLRNVIGSLSLEEALTSRDKINADLRIVLDEATERWGLRVNRIELKSIDPPSSIQEAMEKQMRAERERRAVILNAEGVKQAQILTAEGEKQAAILRAEGATAGDDPHRRGRRSRRRSSTPRAKRRRHGRCSRRSTTAIRRPTCSPTSTSRICLGSPTARR